MTAQAHDPRRRPILLAAVAVVSWFVVAGMLSPGQAVEFASAATAKLLLAAWPAAVYLLAAAGLGSGLRTFVRSSADPTLASSSLGLAVMLTWSHVMGQLGLMAGAVGMTVSWAPVVLGLALLASRFARHASPSSPESILPLIPAIFGGAALLLAASLSPGTAWPSEFGGFDSLSYHLPLPQEWLARGKLEPLTHNTYSFLPSYIEAAFLHLLVMTNAPPHAQLSAGDAAGMLAGDGWRTLSCQYLHAGLGIWTAWAAGRVASVWLRDTLGDAAPSLARRGAAVARTAVLCTPWTLVVGSLSYNELGVTALGAGALLVAGDHRLSPLGRGTLCGLLVGVATGVKPTAAFMLGAPAGVLLAASTPARAWAWLVLGGASATVLAVLPWTIRNAIACGNPVFPYATGWFGLAHWSPEQLAAYKAAHHEPGTLGQKLTLAFSLPGNTPPRGLMHAQWAGFFPLLLAAGVLAAVSRRTRRVATILALATILGLASWLLLTHIQSRFLIPLLPVGAIGIALGLSGGLGGILGESRHRLALGGAHALLLAGFAWFLLKSPIQGSVPWPAEFAGVTYRPSLERALPAERLKFFDQEIRPEWFINLTLPSSAKVYMLGGSTPFYVQTAVIYHVAWERSPLGEAMRRTPATQAQAQESWLAELRSAGITHVLVDFGELARLLASGYSDPIVTPKVVAEWLGPRSQVLRMWGPPNGPTHVLFSIVPGPRGLALSHGANP